jgi:hypothetical protein
MPFCVGGAVKAVAGNCRVSVVTEATGVMRWRCGLASSCVAGSADPPSPDLLLPPAIPLDPQIIHSRGRRRWNRRRSPRTTAAAASLTAG